MILKVNNLTKQYKKNKGVFNISFNIEEGDIFGLLGPNGCGKTTIMKAVTGLQNIQEGSIKIFDYNILENRSEALKEVGSLIEHPAYISYLSGYENLKIISNFYENPLDVNNLLGTVGLSNSKKEKVSTYSLGMKQRLGIALALIGNPKFLILDEPTNGLDIEATVFMRNLILDLVQKNGGTILISSHLASEIEKICNKVGIMREGKLVKIENMSYILNNFPSLEDYYIQTITELGREKYNV